MQPRVEKSNFAQLPGGTTVDLFTLTNGNGLLTKVTNFGTVITELHVPDRDGQLGDIVLGFDNLEQYLQGHPYFGCTVGRVANRIAKGRFTLEGRTYQLAVNNGPNHLHGGLKAFDKVVWKAETLPGAAVRFSYTSPDGEESYPGTLEVVVTISLTEANELSIDYTARTDKTTPVNLTNHSYFNLAGSGDVLSHDLMISADYFTPTDANLIPTGDITPVRGTSMDFTTPKAIGSRFSELKTVPAGYDHNYVVNRAGKGLALAARVHDSSSGRLMEVYTTQPGVQFYTGNFLDGSLKGKRNVVYRQHSGFCLETQHYPDSVNHPSFPSTLLRPSQPYHHTTVHRFSAR